MKMKIVSMLAVHVLLALTLLQKASAQKMDKTAFYAAITTGTKEDIDKELSALTDADQGYAGALIIRKAGLPGAKSRLKLFKEGKAKLEAAIAADPDNTDLRFLRLSIQERSPKIVGYKSNMEADKAYLIKHFDKLSPTAQHAVKEYAKTSKIIKPTDF